jgi:uncharacterized membrane protein
MTTKNLAIVGLRLLAIYCFVQCVPLLSMLSTYLSSNLGMPASELLSFLLAGGSLLLMAVLLFVFSVPLAGRLAPDDPAGQKEMVCTFEQLQATAFAVAGILILVDVVPKLVRVLSGLISLYSQRRDGLTPQPRDFAESWVYLVTEVATVVLGLLLVLNPRGLRNAWHWLRTAGTGPAA